MTAHTDGACRGNPGPAAGAAVIMKDGEVIAKRSKVLGIATNNRAEYEAVILALEAAIELKASSLKVFTDSQLIARQIKGSYKVKKSDLIPLHDKVVELKNKLDRFEIFEVPREKNVAADNLANEALDSKFTG